MLPFRQVGANATVAAGTPAAVTTQSAAVLVSAPAANTGMAYFSYGQANAAPAATAGIPVPPGATFQICTPGNAEFWYAEGQGLLVTPIEILHT